MERIWGKSEGYSLDAGVKFFRLLGVSPETSAADIKQTFLDVGIGEVVEIKKGFLDEKRLPGVSNGTWTLRVKILDEEKFIPSYIHRRDEGEIWSLNFEGRIFCCWKCGSGQHIGDKCRDQLKTFEEVFNGSASDPDFVTPTWASVVRTGKGVSDLQQQRTKDMESKLKEMNKRRRAESRDSAFGADHTGGEEHSGNTTKGRKVIVPSDKVVSCQQISDSTTLNQSVTDSQMLQIAAAVNLPTAVDATDPPIDCPAIVSDMVDAAIDKVALRAADDHELTDKNDLSLVFGPGASSMKFSDNNVVGESGLSDMSPDKATSTPLRQRSRGRRRNRDSGRSLPSSPSPVRPPSQKVKLDETDFDRNEGKGENGGQGEDLLDPGDKSSGSLEDSGDWGDSIDGLDERKEESSKVNFSQDRSSSVDKDSGNPRVLG